MTIQSCSRPCPVFRYHRISDHNKMNIKAFVRIQVRIPEGWESCGAVVFLMTQLSILA